MRRNEKPHLCLCLTLLFFVTDVQAKRSLTFSNIPRRIVADFSKTAAGGPTPIGTAVGFQLSVHIFLSAQKDGNTTQTGTLRLNASDLNGRGTIIRAGQRGRSAPVNVYTFACADSTSGQYGGSLPGASTQPATVQWTLSPGQTKEFTVGVYFTARYDPTSTTAGFTFLDGLFSPQITIETDADPGYLVASTVSMVDGPAFSGGLCDGGPTFPNPPAYAYVPLPIDRASTPIPLNGGHAF